MSSDIPAGVIDADQVYSLGEFRRRTGMGVWALRSARKRGLKVRYTGGRGFVCGQDFLEFLCGAI